MKAACDEKPPTLDDIEASLRLVAKTEPLYTVLDASRDMRILEILQVAGAQRRSLYEGPQGDALASVAPYLVTLLPDSPLLRTIVREGWNKGWGIYLTSHLPFLELRRHLRKFLLVRVEGSRERFYFRFYDPDIINSFLQTCTPAQRLEFFGNIERFLFKDTGGLVCEQRADPSSPQAQQGSDLATRGEHHAQNQSKSA